MLIYQTDNPFMKEGAIRGCFYGDIPFNAIGPHCTESEPRPVSYHQYYFVHNT